MQDQRWKTVRYAAKMTVFAALCASLLIVLSPPQAVSTAGPAPELAAERLSSAQSTEAAPQAGTRLIPLGRTTGIKLFAQGPMVVGFSELEQTGTCPAKDDGLELGDVLLQLDGQPLDGNEALIGHLAETPRDTLCFTVLRDGEAREITVNAVYDDELDCRRIGAWVRDSVAGIGTVTFVDPVTGTFGALGHGICDADTGELVPFGSGSLMASCVDSVEKGKRGEPGQLCGSFDLLRDQGTLYANGEAGIFGVLRDGSLYSGLEALETAPRSALYEGEVTIVCNVSGIEREEYQARILRVYPEGGETGRDLMLEITDRRLLDQTGGIVQGMSGSPIIQDGKLVGAVTHVLVNDPTRGYGISIEEMLKAAG
ncbi:MAG: PDZ domain-containing protein [Clostridia bacterium]|nr:PDZ domain-containing protein [Clostridia bacterium]